MITPAQAKEKFPLLEESMIQGALWDPDAGLVKPRSQMVAGELVDAAVATGKLQSFANTACTGLKIENGRIQGVETTKGYIAADYVVVSAGLWGRLIAGMAGEDLPIMPVAQLHQKVVRLSGVIMKRKTHACAIHEIC
jgi:glycine/D-amino acid oxidase-like deaminating enzyme